MSFGTCPRIDGAPRSAPEVGADAGGPAIEVRDRALEEPRARLEAADRPLQLALGPAQAGAGGVLGDAEEDPELAAGELLPEVELEDDLRGERDLAEALEEEEPLALDREARDRALAEVDDRHR